MRIFSEIKQTNKMEILISFGGFYDSIHSDNIEENFAIELDCRGLIIVDEDYEINYKSTHSNYSRAWLDRFNKECGTDLKFVGIDSPRSYNLTTDKIIAEINDNDRQIFYEMTENESFIEWADPQLRSREGFSSFYDGILDLISKAKDDEGVEALLIGMIVDWQIEEGNINDDIYELEYELDYNESVL